MTAEETAVERAADALWMPSQEMVEAVVKGIRGTPPSNTARAMGPQVHI